MTECSQRYEIRCIPRRSPDFIEVLHRVLDLKPPSMGNESSPQVDSLLADADRGSLSLDLLFAAYRRGELVAASLAIESPGAAAMVFLSGRSLRDSLQRATVQTLKALQQAAWGRSIALLEVLLPSGRKDTASLVAAAGFRFLTRLRYLNCNVSRQARSRRFDRPIDWVCYSPDRESLFEEAVERTYLETQDCPELSSLRKTKDVIAGHQATGVFDPSLWWVAMRGGEPVGVVLLSRMSGERALELVYMGVAQSVRGTGVSDALLTRTMETARRRGVKHVALAVDERNQPARRMYARWGFVEIGVRDAWIATPDPVRG